MLLQAITNDMDDTLQTGFEDTSYMPAYSWIREEPYSSENSGSSEFLAQSTTAANKLLITNTPIDDSSKTDWTTKSVRQWASDDIMWWIVSVANDSKLNAEDINISHFSMIDGTTLYMMTEEDFVSREAQCGKLLYRILQQLKQEQDQPVTYGSHRLPPVSTIEAEKKPEKREYYELLVNLTSPCLSDNHQSSDEFGVPVPSAGKRRPGRPRLPGRRGKKTEKKTGRLWEFIRDLLLNREYCPSLICWENHDEGMFRFVRSEKVAKLWGSLKDNPKMTYEKLSRAMRYYYKSKVLQPVVGRRLVYKFGPTATGWKTTNPNFRV